MTPIEYPMPASIFAEFKFWLLIVFSIIVPFAIYWLMMARRAISQATTLMLGFALIAIAALDVYLLQSLSAAAKHTPSLADDALFVSELTLALYVLPGMFAGIGINVVSSVLIRHLGEAEKASRESHPDS